MKKSEKIKRGDRVAHKEIDSDKGSAYAGVVFDKVGDEEQEMILVQTEDGKLREAYDRRELVSLGDKKKSSGPIILKKRHLKNLLSLRQVRLVIMFEAVLIALFVASSIIWDFSLEKIGLLAAASLLVATITFLLLEKELS
jgi:hypothetical protein